MMGAIGVFDSGIGGLTVAREIMKRMPSEKIVYFGDTARLPYGSKSKETIIDYSREIVAFLKTKDVKAVVIACNTATAAALDTLSGECDIPVLGVIRAGAREAARSTKNGKIGIIATAGTVGSMVYPSEIHKINAQAEVVQTACPLFVSLVEEGWWDTDVTKLTAEKYLADVKKAGADTLVLGCTHFPLIKKTIAEVMGDQVALVDPAHETAMELKSVLAEHGLLEADGITPVHEFYASALSGKYTEFASSILPGKLSDGKAWQKVLFS